MVDVLQMPPEKSVLTSARYTEVPVVAAIREYDKSAPGYEIARGVAVISICGAACEREGERRDAGRKTCPNRTHDHSSVTEWPRWRTRGPRLRYRRRQDAGRSRRCRPRWPFAR